MNNVESPKLMKGNNNCNIMKKKRKKNFEKRSNKSKLRLKGNFMILYANLMM